MAHPRETITGTTTVGARLPDLTLADLHGGFVKFADLRGRKTLLFFWGSW